MTEVVMLFFDRTSLYLYALFCTGALLDTVNSLVLSNFSGNIQTPKCTWYNNGNNMLVLHFWLTAADLWCTTAFNSTMATTLI